MTGRALLVRGDALRLPVADETVDLIVTSPPFWSLRSYTDHGEHYAGQLGSEPTPAAFIANLLAVTAELVRVLKPSGSLWVELGDKYAQATERHRNGDSGSLDGGLPVGGIRRYAGALDNDGIRQKSLVGLPWRYAIGCIDHLGLILRAEVVWSKLNGLPESVTDRVARTHTTWFHLVKQPHYYAAIDEIREPHKHDPAGQSWWLRGKNYPVDMTGHINSPPNPLGKLPGSVWPIPSEPLIAPDHLGVQHYAAFPTEIVRRIILGWSPPGICDTCGQGRVPVVESRYVPARARGGDGSINRTRKAQILPGDETLRSSMDTSVLDKDSTILGYACACTPHTDHPANDQPTGRRNQQPMPDARPQGDYGRKQAGEYQRAGPWREYHLDRWQPPATRPAVVLDPFAGTGTVPLVARTLGRAGIGVELSADYLKLAKWRVWSSRHGAKAEARTWAERQGALPL